MVSPDTARTGTQRPGTEPVPFVSRQEFPTSVRAPLSLVFDAAHHLRWTAAVAMVVLTMAVAWFGTWATGGTHTVAPHLFYFPIIIAASRFHWRGAVATALVAGIIAGPLIPLDVVTGSAQAPGSWISRVVMFVVIGVFLSWLFSESQVAVVTRVRDAQGARELREALSRGEFEVHYQPIFDLETMRTTGSEALLRRRSDGRLVPPCEFIPLAERTGVIVDLEKIVIDQATTQTASWATLGPGNPDLTIAINVSAVHLDDAGFVRQIEAALVASGLRPEQLCVEITETAIITNFDAALAALTDLSKLGVMIALDDFGTGHSSLSYLKRLPIDLIKIDLSFVADVDVNPRCAAVVAGIVLLARSLGATTVAEGIERRSQLDALVELGCARGQGFLVDGALPPALFETRHATEDA